MDLLLDSGVTHKLQDVVFDRLPTTGDGLDNELLMGASFDPQLLTPTHSFLWIPCYPSMPSMQETFTGNH